MNSEVGAWQAVPPPRRRNLSLNLLGIAIIAWQAIAGIELRSPVTPATDPRAACGVAPRSREEIALLLDDLGIATPAATTAGQTLPEGDPVSAEAADAIERLVRTWLACQNAGQSLRAWALFSDGYLRRLLARQGPSQAVASMAGTPTSEANGGATLLEITGERELEDGRLGATVVIAYASVPTPKTFFFYFTERDGRLLIDGILGEISFSVP